MTAGAKALIKWLKEKVLVAYAEPVSTAASLPYISISYSEGDFSESINQSLTIWTRSDASYAEAYGYADKLSKELGEQGAIIKDDDSGAVFYVTKGSPFVQIRLDDTKTIRAVLANIVLTKIG
jgi:hypothetical protein